MSRLCVNKHRVMIINICVWHLCWQVTHKLFTNMLLWGRRQESVTSAGRLLLVTAHTYTHAHTLPSPPLCASVTAPTEQASLKRGSARAGGDLRGCRNRGKQSDLTLRDISIPIHYTHVSVYWIISNPITGIMKSPKLTTQGKYEFVLFLNLHELTIMKQQYGSSCSNSSHVLIGST